MTISGAQEITVPQKCNRKSLTVKPFAK